MTISSPNGPKSLEAVVGEICALRPRLEGLIHQFRHSIEQLGSSNSSDLVTKSGPYWRLVAFVDSLVRVRLFLEQNFTCVETIGVLAVSRYLFELTVWLKILRMDSRCGLVYYGELLKKQLEFYKELQNNAVREVAFLRKVGSEEQALIQKRFAETMQISDEEARKVALRQLSNDVTQEIDRAAARSFSLYAEQAQTNGYDFQAHLVESKALPQIGKAIGDLEQKVRSFEHEAPSDIRSLVPKRWVDRAAKVNMKDEYDFIYAYASRLLHATPASLTTNQKNLEPDEMRGFLKYIRVRIIDLIDMSQEMLSENQATIQ